jgi:predicted acetyltransferase
MSMEKEMMKAIKEYKESHPEVDEIMRKFQISQEAYEKALASISIKVRKTGPTYCTTTEVNYNVNVSGTT